MFSCKLFLRNFWEGKMIGKKLERTFTRNCCQLGGPLEDLFVGYWKSPCLMGKSWEIDYSYVKLPEGIIHQLITSHAEMQFRDSLWGWASNTNQGVSGGEKEPPTRLFIFVGGKKGVSKEGCVSKFDKVCCFTMFYTKKTGKWRKKLINTGLLPTCQIQRAWNWGIFLYWLGATQFPLIWIAKISQISIG